VGTNQELRAKNTPRDWQTAEVPTNAGLIQSQIGLASSDIAEVIVHLCSRTPDAHEALAIELEVSG
jgi:hypothetical protein